MDNREKGERMNRMMNYSGFREVTHFFSLMSREALQEEMNINTQSTSFCVHMTRHYDYSNTNSGLGSRPWVQLVLLPLACPSGQGHLSPPVKTHTVVVTVH